MKYITSTALESAICDHEAMYERLFREGFIDAIAYSAVKTALFNLRMRIEPSITDAESEKDIA